jgi:hypothetical protein
MSDRDVAVRTLPQWFTLLGGHLYEQCAVTITRGTLHEAAVDNRVPTNGGVGRTHRSSRRATKHVGTGIFSKNPLYRGFPAADDPKDLRRQTLSLLRLRSAPILRSHQSRPQGKHKLAWLSAASERHTMVMLPGCLP